MGDGEGVSFNGRGLPPVLLSAVLLLQLRVNVLSFSSFIVPFYFPSLNN